MIDLSSKKRVKDAILKKISLKWAAFEDYEDGVDVINRMGTDLVGRRILPTFYHTRKFLQPLFGRLLDEEYKTFGRENFERIDRNYSDNTIG